MVPIESLQREHRLITTVLDAAEFEAEQITRRGGFDAATVGGFMDFLRVFVHGLHGIKEEYHLFVYLERRMVTSNQLSLVPLLRGYDECRRELQSIANLLLPSIQGDYWTALALAEHIRSYCQRMRAHIDREETEVFPLAEAILKPADELALIEEFRALAGKVGIDVIHRQRQTARALSRISEPEAVSSADLVEIHFG